MDGLPITDLDLASYGGISIAVVLIVGLLKTTFRKLIKGRESILVFALTAIIGVAAKLTIKETFTDVSWVAHIVGLFFAAIGAFMTHDKVSSPLTKKLTGNKKNWEMMPPEEKLS